MPREAFEPSSGGALVGRRASGVVVGVSFFFFFFFFGLTPSFFHSPLAVAPAVSPAFAQRADGPRRAPTTPHSLHAARAALRRHALSHAAPAAGAVGWSGRLAHDTTELSTSHPGHAGRLGPPPAFLGRAGRPARTPHATPWRRRPATRHTLVDIRRVCRRSLPRPARRRVVARPAARRDGGPGRHSHRCDNRIAVLILRCAHRGRPDEGPGRGAGPHGGGGRGGRNGCGR